MTWPFPQDYVPMKEPSGPTLEELMEKGETRLLNGREIILGYIDKRKRIGWVWKDTGLPASMEETT